MLILSEYEPSLHWLLHLSFDLIQSICDMLYHVASVVVEWDGRGDIFVTLRAEFNGLWSAVVS